MTKNTQNNEFMKLNTYLSSIKIIYYLPSHTFLKTFNFLTKKKGKELQEFNKNFIQSNKQNNFELRC